MTKKLNPNITDFIEELYANNYTPSQIKTIFSQLNIDVSYNTIYHKKPEAKKVKKEYDKEYRQRSNVKEIRKEYQKKYDKKSEVKAYRRKYDEKLEFKARDSILKDLDLHIISLIHDYRKLSIKELAAKIKEIGKKTGADFKFINLESRIASAIDILRETAGRDCPIIYVEDDTYEINPASTCWQTYETLDAKVGE